VIYESFKPKTLEEAKEYAKYIMTNQGVVPNEVDEIASYFPLPSQIKESPAEVLSDRLMSYINKQAKSNLYY